MLSLFEEDFGTTATLYATGVTPTQQIVPTSKPARVFSLHIISGADGAASVTMANNTSTVYIKETGTTSAGVTFDYGEDGIFFTQGISATFDDINLVSATIQYRVEAQIGQFPSKAGGLENADVIAVP